MDFWYDLRLRELCGEADAAEEILADAMVPDAYGTESPDPADKPRDGRVIAPLHWW
ncbi:MAG: hypothetical protein HY726_20975 [Candidatus Rokubacteria bacterium]|nr:hypothetical protein [Candidatus Rokubacteria bacterium]